MFPSSPLWLVLQSQFWCSTSRLPPVPDKDLHCSRRRPGKPPIATSPLQCYCYITKVRENRIQRKHEGNQIIFSGSFKPMGTFFYLILGEASAIQMAASKATTRMLNFMFSQVFCYCWILLGSLAIYIGKWNKEQSAATTKCHIFGQIIQSNWMMTLFLGIWKIG